MNYTLGMHVLEAANELIGKHQHRLEGESALAKAEEVFQTWAEEIKDHHSVIALFSIPVDSRDASLAGESLVDHYFVLQRGIFPGVVFKLNCYFVTRIIIQSFDRRMSVVMISACSDVFACIYQDRQHHSRRHRASAQDGISCPLVYPTLSY